MVYIGVNIGDQLLGIHQQKHFASRQFNAER